MDNGPNRLSRLNYLCNLANLCSRVASYCHFGKPLALECSVETVVVFIVCFVCVFLRMTSLFSRDFPPLPSQSSSPPDFSKLRQGINYIITYTSLGEETRVLMADIQNVTVQIASNSQDGTFSPPSTRSGTKYSLTTYPVRRKNEPNNRGQRSLLRGNYRGGNNGGSTCGGNNNFRGGFQKQNYTARPSYSQAVTSSQ